MENQFCFLELGKGGCYTVVVPDFKERRFVETENTVKANTLTLFGLPFPLQYTEHVMGNAENDKKEEDVADRVFKTFAEKLARKMKEYGADYILLSHQYCDRDGSTDWMAQCQCQFLLKLN